MVGDIDPRGSFWDWPGRIDGLSAALSRRGHQVTIYTLESGQRGDRPDAGSGCRVVRVPTGRAQQPRARDTISLMGHLARYLDDDWGAHPPDVAHAHSWEYGLAAQLAADRRGVPTVQTFRPLLPSARASDSERSKVEHLLVKKAAWVAAECTEAMLAHIRLGSARTRTSVLDRGVDVGAFTPPGARDLDDNHRVIVAGPDLSEHHGADIAVRALSGMPAAELLVVGDRGTAPLRRLADESGVGDRIQFTPKVSYTELPELLLQAGVVACIPRAEPADSVVLEAMAAGIPVIASAVGELLDIVVNEVTGLLIKPGSASDLARAMRALYEDSFRRQGMGFAGRTRVRSRYTWDRVVADALAVYAKVRTADESPVFVADGRPDRLSV